MMSNQDKEKAVENSASIPPRLAIEIEDSPPPYTPYKTTSNPKPPPLPSAPPAIIRDPLPDTRPQITRNPGSQMTDNTAYQAWEGCKTGCSRVVSWSWKMCGNCVDGCISLCPESKCRQNQ